LSATFQGLGQDLTPSPPPAATTVVQPAAPVITEFAIAAGSQTGFEFRIKGFATPQEVATVTFVFAPIAGSALQNATIALDVADLFRRWYQDPASMFLGSAFQLAIPFTVQSGSLKALAAVSVVLSNSKGISAGMTQSFPK